MKYFKKKTFNESFIFLSYQKTVDVKNQTEKWKFDWQNCRYEKEIEIVLSLLSPDTAVHTRR